MLENSYLEVVKSLYSESKVRSGSSGSSKWFQTTGKELTFSDGLSWPPSGTVEKHDVEMNPEEASLLMLTMPEVQKSHSNLSLGDCCSRKTLPTYSDNLGYLRHLHPQKSQEGSSHTFRKVTWAH